MHLRGRDVPTEYKTSFSYGRILYDVFWKNTKELVLVETLILKE